MYMYYIVTSLRPTLGLDFPVVVKPVLSSASDGVFLCHDQAELRPPGRQHVLSTLNTYSV